MKKTLILMSSNREMEPETRQSLRVLTKLGAALLQETGSSDVAFARCRALSWACEHLRGELADRDVVLMLDDDMEVPEEVAQGVVDKARELGKPCAAAYATRTSKLAAQRWKDNLWLSGLGCMAIPVSMLFELEQRCESFEMMGKVLTAFTWSGPDRGRWVSEDYRLSIQLGGVHLLPLPAGHVKKATLLPDDETLEKIAKFEPLS